VTNKGTAHADGSLATARRPAPCDDCVHRKLCASDVRLACEAYAVYVNGKDDFRAWRDADRTPLQSVARRLVVEWHGEKSAKELFDGK
jgi:hypothetical protein